MQGDPPSTETYSQPSVTPASSRYRPPLARVTSNKKLQSGSRKVPATTVSGSPMIGTQLSNNYQRP